MIIHDVRREFFDKLKGRVLIMCSLDVDAICACKILQSLLEAYNIQYSVVPVANIEHLEKSFSEYSSSVDFMILLNFGNSINLQRLLKPPRNLTLFVIDSHRPIDVHNYYKNRNVKVLLNKQERDLNIPDEKRIFTRRRQRQPENESQESVSASGQQVGADDDEDEEKDDDDLALLNADPRELTNEQLTRRQELRSWLVKKTRLMFEYTEFNYYNRAAAVIIYELAWNLSKDNNYLLWLAMVGLTYQWSSEKIEQELFDHEARKLERHIARLRLKHSSGNSTTANASSSQRDRSPVIVRSHHQPQNSHRQRTSRTDFRSLFGADDNDSLFSDTMSQSSRIADPTRTNRSSGSQHATSSGGPPRKDAKSWDIRWQRDLQIDLYRKWSIYDSLWHTQLTVCRFKLWNDKGQRNLLEFLVECGLKLAQCKQTYVAMDLDYKKNLLDDVQGVCQGDFQDKYNLQDLICKSFVVTCGFKNTFCANDVVLALRALLESNDPDQTSTAEKFVRAIQSLACDDFSLLDTGFKAARRQLKSIFELVKALIVTMKVNDLGVFLHVDLQECANNNTLHEFARGDSLMAFARFLLCAYVASKNTRTARRARLLPLVLFAPDFDDPDQTVIVGIPPLAKDSNKNYFAKAFEQAAENLGAEISASLSETNLIKANFSVKNPILEQLKSLIGGE